MQTQPEIRAADDKRIVFGLEPSRAQMDAARGQAREPAFEFGSPGAVAGDQDHEIRKAPRPARRFPAANAIFEPEHGVDDDVEVFVLGPARRTDEEADK